MHIFVYPTFKSLLEVLIPCHTQKYVANCHVCIITLACRSTTIPGRTKGKRKVQIKIPNCPALQIASKPLPVIPRGGGGGGGGGGGIGGGGAVGGGGGSGGGGIEGEGGNDCAESNERYIYTLPIYQ